MNEGYLPLYRKYRPQKLEDIVGQAHIKRALSNAIELNKIAHAYLFTGPRGTGKTSTARILAKSLNCVNGPTVTPCEECESCKSITNTVPIDVIEMDAASNRSVDDAQEILEKVNYAPVQGKYKIYIIDEVHMLTPHAFNALLKTLEEPPKNVIFILATTESHKVMDTIKSRCQRFDFKRITTNDIIEYLKKIATKENIKITDGAISLIAKSSAGGMRDSLSLLDQVSNIGLGDAEITEDDINSLLGRLSFDSLFELTTHIVNSDGASAINVLEKIYNDGNEPIQILTNLMLFFKNLLIAKTCGMEDAKTLTGMTQEQLSQLEGLVKSLEKHQVIFLINKVADYIKDLRETTNQQMWLEVSLIDLANLADNTKLFDLEARLSRLESGNVDTAPQRQLQREIKPIENSVVEEKPVAQVEQKSDIQEQKEIKTEQKNAANVDVSDLGGLWTEIIKVLVNNDISGIAKMKAATSLIKCDDEGIVIVGSSASFVEKLNVPEKKQKLVNVIYDVIGKSNIPVTIRVKSASDATPQNIKSSEPKKKTNLPPKDLMEIQEYITENEVETVNQVKQEHAAKRHDEADLALSEQGRWVVDLFDGKVIK